MSWTEIAPLQGYKSGVSKPAIEMTVGKLYSRGDTKRWIAYLTIRTKVIPDCPLFLADGGSCRVLQGSGDDAGKLRLMLGSAHRLGVPGGAKTREASDGVFVLRFPLPASVREAPGRSAVEFDHALSWLEVDIPVWALSPAEKASRSAMETAATVVPAAAAPKKAMGVKGDEVFSMLGGSVPAAGRRA